MQTSSARIPTLDGWRGVAILMVLIAHAEAGLLGRAWKYDWLDIGQHGVTIFFVLSGYLITSRLLAEDLRDLRSFYIRRFFRLMPVVWTYLIFICAFAAALHIHIIGRDITPCLFLYRNYVAETPTNAMTSHFWSLSIEEQYYLLWPSVLLLAGRKRAFAFAFILAFACAGYRFLFWAKYLIRGGLNSEVRMDALLIGSALGIALEHPAFRRWVRQYANALIMTAGPVLVICIARFHKLTPISEVSAIAALLAATSMRPDSLCGRMLDQHHLAFVGSISYSLYVWQEFFLVPHWGPLAPIMIALLPLAAIMSYGLVERPCRRLGARIIRPTPGTPPESSFERSLTVS